MSENKKVDLARYRNRITNCLTGRLLPYHSYGFGRFEAGHSKDTFARKEEIFNREKNRNNYK